VVRKFGGDLCMKSEGDENDDSDQEEEGEGGGHHRNSSRDHLTPQVFP
jgi:hypothetical protein